VLAVKKRADVQKEENSEARFCELLWNRHCHKNSQSIVETVGQ